MRILLSGGGTAGHITPLLAVAAELKKQAPDTQLIFMGQRGDKNASVVLKDQSIERSVFIRAGKFRRFHSLTLWQNITNFKVNLLNIRDSFNICIGFVQAFFWLAVHQPDAIFFKGGFVVVPIGMAARLLRIPYITHDSDPLPGLANRLIAGGAKKNAVVNESVTAYPREKTLVSGIPLAPEYEERRGVVQMAYKQKLDIPQDAVLVFVFAGTQGARVVDDALEGILPRLLDKYPNLWVNYVFGRLNEHTMNERFSTLDDKLLSRLRLLTFVDNAYDHIAAADVIVGRAGATSMAEFATIGRASIIVPAEQLTGGHQLKNAEIFEDNDAAVIVRERSLPDSLEKALCDLIENKELREELAAKIRKVAPSNAAGVLASEILQIAKRKN